jgi:integrase
MVQQVKSSKLDRSARLRLPVKKKPYFVRLDRGLALGYRRTLTAGTWVMRVTKDDNDWTQAFAKADDHEDSNGTTVLTYAEAQTKARELAKGGKSGGDHTVAAALDRYEDDLKSRGGDIANVSRARGHLTHKLSMKAVSSLTNDDLKAWRDSLNDKKLVPASINRVITTLRAALNLAAQDSDGRIRNREAWKSGLKAIGGAGRARNVVLLESDVRTIIGAAYRRSDEFGLLIEVLAVTGTRTSQALRLQGENVQADFKDPRTRKRQPRLMMPASRKGRGEKKKTHQAVPIPESLAKRLSGVQGQLLKRPDGDSWTKTNLPVYFEDAIKAVELDSKERVTIKALRHTSIVRQLLVGVPIRVVAVLHDTSVEMIESNYSEHIADHADDMVRPALLETIAEVIELPPPSRKARTKKGVPEVPE